MLDNKENKISNSDFDGQKNFVVSNQKWFQGIPIAILASIGVACTAPAQTHGFSVSINSFIDEFGISRSSLATSYLIGTVGGGFTQPFLGPLLDKHGSQKVGVLTLAAFGSSCFVLSQAQEWYSLTFAFFCMRMTGQASTSMCCSYVINKWWIKKRGRVTGISTFFNSLVGTAALPLMLAYGNSTWGWRNTYVAYGVFLISMLLPLWLFIIRDTPECIGQLPDGEQIQTSSQTETLTSANHEESSQQTELKKQVWTKQTAIRTPFYIIAALAFSSNASFSTGFIFNLISILQNHGLTQAEAVQYFIPRSASFAISSLFVGYCADKINPKYITGIGLILQVITFIGATFIKSGSQAWLLGLINGLGNAFLTIAQSVIWAHFFGRDNLGEITAPQFAINIIASGLGPYPLSLAYEITGSYSNALYIFSLIQFILAIGVMVVPDPKLESQGFQAIEQDSQDQETSVELTAIDESVDQDDE